MIARLTSCCASPAKWLRLFRMASETFVLAVHKYAALNALGLFLPLQDLDRHPLTDASTPWAAKSPLTIVGSLHRTRDGFEIVLHSPTIWTGGSGQAHRFQEGEACRQVLLANARKRIRFTICRRCVPKPLPGGRSQDKPAASGSPNRPP
jgi:hypothetical protein